MSSWEVVCDLNDLVADKGKEVFVNGRPLALFMHQGKVYAMDDRCPHREGQLSQGAVENGEAICPLHGWNFDLETGISPYNPKDRLDTFPVRVNDSRVEVDASAVPPLPAATFEGYLGRWRRWSAGCLHWSRLRRLTKSGRTNRDGRSRWA